MAFVRQGWIMIGVVLKLSRDASRGTTGPSGGIRLFEKNK